ncbi:MAG: Hpt domain-containing protein [Gemmatimonadales bacterium]
MPVEINQIIDETILDSYRALQEVDQPDVVTEFIDVFLEDLPTRLERLTKAVDRSVIPEIRSAAHALKGSSGSVGAIALSGACSQLEALARTGSADGARELHARVMVESKRAVEELARFRKP